MNFFGNLFNRKQIRELQADNAALLQRVKEVIEHNNRLTRQSQTNLDTSTTLLAQLSKVNEELQNEVYSLKAQIQEAEFFPVYQAKKDYYATVAEYTKFADSIKQFSILNVPDDGSLENTRIRMLLNGVVESIHSINKKVFTVMTTK